MKMKCKELRKRLMIKFKGEEGIDYGGLARYQLHLFPILLIFFLFQAINKYITRKNLCERWQTI